jgi:hypothetical protein
MMVDSIPVYLDQKIRSFNEPGIYSYFCSPHPWMTGFVIVADQDDEDSINDEGEQEEDDDD